MFVVAIRPEDNTVVLGEADEVFSINPTASDLNFISIPGLSDEIRVTAKIRYSAKEADAVVRPLTSDTVEVLFDELKRAVTPGQSVAFLPSDIVVGGGVID